MNNEFTNPFCNCLEFFFVFQMKIPLAVRNDYVNRNSNDNHKNDNKSHHQNIDLIYPYECDEWWDKIWKVEITQPLP